MYVVLLHSTYFVWYRAESVWVTVWAQHWTSEQTAVDGVHRVHDSSVCTAVLHFVQQSGLHHEYCKVLRGVKCFPASDVLIFIFTYK
jgi:hypothetical protein